MPNLELWSGQLPRLWPRLWPSQLPRLWPSQGPRLRPSLRQQQPWLSPRKVARNWAPLQRQRIFKGNVQNMTRTEGFIAAVDQQWVFQDDVKIFPCLAMLTGKGHPRCWVISAFWWMRVYEKELQDKQSDAYFQNDVVVFPPWAERHASCWWGGSFFVFREMAVKLFQACRVCPRA